MSERDYSATPLARKLGIEPGSLVAIAGAPSGFAETLGPLPEGAQFRTLRTARLDVILLFVRQEAALHTAFRGALRKLDTAGGLWVVWPKRASGVSTDLTFEVVQRIGLESGLVDNKIAAIDATWSGLRFVVRKEHREDWPPEG
ncbi:MAG: DUF3052 domain-containing protein [Acidimicrobiia bacterium]